MSKHLPKLIELAQQKIPMLENDIKSAGNFYQLKPIVEDLLTIVTYLLHDAILNSRGPSAPRPQAPLQPPATVPQPVPRPAPVVTPVPPSDLPPLPTIGKSTAVPSLPQNLPGDVPHQPGVATVIVSAQGTTVVSPGGNRSVLPPGVPVPPEATSDVPPTLPPPVDDQGVPNVVLPPGGGMTPELAAALAGRSQDEPPAK